ncbi:hypothetical protein AAZX31_10G079600 [Glycine max]
MPSIYTQDLAASIDEGDVEKFTRVVNEFNSITPLVYFCIQDPSIRKNIVT